MYKQPVAFGILVFVLFALLLIKFDTLGMRFIEYLITYSFVRMMSYFND